MWGGNKHTLLLIPVKNRYYIHIVPGCALLEEEKSEREVAGCAGTSEIGLLSEGGINEVLRI